jgi:large conductance mechanosensitive channel
MLKGFREFIFRGNVVDLAIAVVIGAAFTDIVNALVSDLITPLIGLIGGKPDFSFLKLTFNGTDFLVGDFVNALIAFLIIAAVVYFAVVMPMSKVLARMKKGQVEQPGTKICPDCLSAIPLKAKKCAFCTSLQPAKAK